MRNIDFYNPDKLGFRFSLRHLINCVPSSKLLNLAEFFSLFMYEKRKPHVKWLAHCLALSKCSEVMGRWAGRVADSDNYWLDLGAMAMNLR